MQPTGVIRRVLPLALAFGAVACSDLSSPETLTTIDRGGLPFVRGEVTAVDASRGTLVEGVGSAGAPTSAYVRLTPTTKVLWNLDGMAGKADIVVGRTVAVWTEGLVLESHPAQVTAAMVVIEGKSRD
ncbi:MAG: hypothetical protein ACYC2G_11615 [Gemmatimonadaceae bacterium]